MKTRLQKTGESLQEYASEVERLTNLAFFDHPATERNNLFTVFRGRNEGGGSPEGCGTGRCEALKSALLYALKVEAANEASYRDSHSVRGARVTTDAPCGSPWRKEIEKLRKEIQNLMAQRQNLRRRITCWGCGGAGHLRSSCPRIYKEDHNIKCWGCGRVGHKFGVIDPVVRQVATPSTSALDPWSDESVRKDQLADPEIKLIMEFKESSDEKPSWQDIAPFYPTTKRYWALWNCLHLRNGVLYRKWESDDGKTSRWQVILAKTRVSAVLKELHGSPTGGHFGVMKTLQKVRERFDWNNVRSDVEKCYRICDPCAARKGHRKRTRGRLQLYNVGAPFERIAFDILGPLPRSSDGICNILIVMDYFTKWPEAYPIPDQEASTVAEVLVQHWISRLGVPLQLHSDQGKNFDSAVCKRLCEILAINKTRTTALHPQSDGMVERFNRTILDSLSLLVSSNHQDWDRK
ncbi:retrovirus-related Pol polyprotein from transposon 412 [Trichonephila clavipes]|uniref:RNA-directed DNA polymerase n=1 Tax=Trichonephila clavipes TaxID=2585209 RepID=A0A8X6VY03_TRICX|nr:retrovirus-related Pol polyprotein from transposon 412 [Trichonephila clavipes]